MATDYTRQWIQFFTGCGIPDEVAATYGLIFNENRIQKNMLLDLNKEYLRDMGITVMGDVIAILRHAKIVHDKYVREQILSEPTQKSPVESLLIDGSPSKKHTPMKRMLEHYTRKYETVESVVPHEKVHISIENDTNIVNVPKKLAHRIGIQNTVKQRIKAPSMRSDNLTPGKIEVPVPKIRRVLPENEGNYKIKMPSGTTERSKKLLEKAKLKQNKTVFDRLGESSVSSTSDITTTAVGSTPNLGKMKNDRNTASVFSRLGEKSTLVTSTSSNGDTIEYSEQLPYRGILKLNSNKKKICLSPNSTMRADNELHAARSNSNNAIKKIDSVKERLGTNAKGKQSVTSEKVKLNRLQITTSFEEQEPPQISSLSKRFKSIKTIPGESLKEQKNVLDGLRNLRSEKIQNKSTVSSTSQFTDIKQHRLKRRLADIEPIEMDADTADVTQSKKVRFGQTTHRLIPSNAEELKGMPKKYPNLRMLISEGKFQETKNEAEKSNTVSGIRIGVMNSDKMRQKISLKERIGASSLLPILGRAALDFRRKRSLKLINRIKKNATSIHDRLG